MVRAQLLLDARQPLREVVRAGEREAARLVGERRERARRREAHGALVPLLEREEALLRQPAPVALVPGPRLHHVERAPQLVGRALDAQPPGVDRVDAHPRPVRGADHRPVRGLHVRGDGEALREEQHRLPPGQGGQAPDERQQGVGRGEALLVALERLEALDEAALQHLVEPDPHLLAPPALGRPLALGRGHVGLAQPLPEAVVRVARELPLVPAGEGRGRERRHRLDRLAQGRRVVGEPLQDGEPAVDREDGGLRARAPAGEVLERGPPGEAARGRSQAVEREGDVDRLGPGLAARRVLDEGERLDVLPHPVLEHLDLVQAQVAHETPVLVADDEVHLDPLGAHRGEEPGPPFSGWPCGEPRARALGGRTPGAEGEKRENEPEAERHGRTSRSTWVFRAS